MWLYIVLGLVLVAAGVAVMGWYWMTAPMYQPGSARKLGLDPPAQAGSGAWTVEPGIELKYFASGAGRNVLVLHGGPGFPSREPWPGLELLKDRFRFHYYDQRGCGGSTRPFDRFASGGYSNVGTLEGTLGLGAQVADIERIRRILGDEKVVLIGHSFGGLLAALYAAEFPEHVESMVLIAPAAVLVMPDPNGDFFQNIRAKLPPATAAEYDAWYRDYMDFRRVFSKDEKQLAAEHLGFAKYYSLASGADAGAVRSEDVGGWMTRAMYFSMGRRHDYRPALRAVKAPVLVVHGARDLQPQASSRIYAEALPNARFEMVDGCSHFPHIEKPETFAGVLRRFLLKEQ